MKKLYFLLFFVSMLIWNNAALAVGPTPGTYSIGPTGNYPSINAAVSAVTSVGTISGSYIFEFQNTYSSTIETFPISIPAFAGASVSNTVTFRPQIGATVSITSSNKDGTLKLNGAKYVYFDGRAGGVGTAKNLTIENTDLTVFTTNVTVVTSTTSVNVGSTTGLLAGMNVGIGPGAGFLGPNNTIATVLSGTQLTLSSAPTAALAVGNVIIAGWSPSAVIFVNGASYNAVKYCYLKSANQTITSGTVFFSTAVGTVGNNNNSVTYNDICDASSTGITPTVGVYAEAFSTSGRFNDADTISNNNVYNYHRSASSTAGLLLRCSSNWVISGNSFYQTASRAMSTANVQSTAINVTGIIIAGSLVSTTNVGVNNLIQGNYFGGTAPNAGGSSLTFTGSGAFVGIAVWAGTSNKTTVDGNIIKNINYTSDGSGVSARGIAAFMGSIDCINNTIGSQSGNSITLQMNGTTTSTIASMIYAGVASGSVSGTLKVDNNSIGGIVVNSTSINPALRGISLQAAPDVYTISNNIINSISTSSNILIRAIYAAPTSATGSCTISSNAISNITQTSTLTSGQVIGICVHSATNQKVTLRSNKIHDLSTKSSYATLPVVIGIEFLSFIAGNTIEQDTIYALRATNTTTSAVSAVGIYATQTSSGGDIGRNVIYDITNTTVNTGSIITAFRPLGGSWNFTNNMITLSNGANTNATLIAGVYDISGTGTRNYFYNSIYIGGSGPADIYSAAIQYNCNAASTAFIKNNILVMGRSKGGSSTPGFYAIANKTAVTTGLTSDYNILNCTANPSVVALWGASTGAGDKSFTAWKAITSASLLDNNSFTAEYIPFTDTTTGNLHINMADPTLQAAAFVSNIESKATLIASTTIDFDGDTRPGPIGSIRGGAINPDIGADEVDLTYSGDNIWKGITADWFTNTNWTLGVVPGIGTNAVIPTVVSNLYPTITGSAVAKTVVIGLGASVTVTNKLQIAGTVANSGTFDATSGTIEMIGTAAAQSLSGSAFTSRTINNLLISNSFGVALSATANDTLNITGSIGFGNVNNATFTTNDNLTLRSSATATARVMDVTNAGVNNNNTISGKAIVERYLPMQNLASSRRWRLLTAPVQTIGAPTIKDSWQEGVNNATQISLANPRPGYGTQITNGNTAAAVALGFDIGSTSNPSIYYLNPGAAPNWVAVNNTVSTPITNYEGYMIFVRGDRGTAVGSQFIPAKSTNLAVKGNLYIGDLTKNLVAGKQVVGNPYASAIALDKVELNGATFDAAGYYYYQWDPKTDGLHTVGRLITVTNDGVGAGSFSATANTSNFTPGVIESGNAFIVNSVGSPSTIVFHETDKAVTSSTVGIASRPAGSISSGGVENLSKLYTNLLAVNTDGSTAITDGVVNTYHPSYNDEVDNVDAPELVSFNSKQNLSISSHGTMLAIEKRKRIAVGDSITLEMRNMDNWNYRFEFVPKNYPPGIDAFLIDSYTGTETQIDLTAATTSFYNFAVTNSIAASAKIDRFKIVYRQSPIPAIAFDAVDAVQDYKQILVEWKVENESNTRTYEIEKSADGIHFTKIATIPASGSSNYTYTDNDALAGENYYRIKSISNASQVLYSGSVVVTMNNERSALSVYPTIVNNGQTNLHFNNLPAGKYQVKIINITGQLLLSKTIEHTGANTTQTIRFNTAATKGKYFVEVLSPDNTRTVYPLLID